MLTTIALSLTLLVGTPTAQAPAVEAPFLIAQAAPTTDAVELRLALRDLWAGHIFWVRSYVLASHYEDAAGVEVAEAKVVENARAIADAIVPFYGQAAADQLFELLAGHYGAVKDFMVASYAERAQDQEAASQALSANAEAIADFLSAANPNLPKSAVLPLLIAHGGHHMQQIQAIHTEDFAAEAMVRDAMLAHIYTISDALAGALAAQFPEQITG